MPYFLLILRMLELIFLNDGLSKKPNDKQLEVTLNLESSLEKDFIDRFVFCIPAAGRIDPAKKIVKISFFIIPPIL